MIQRKNIKMLIYRILIFPAILIIAPVYKLIRFLRRKKTKVVYSDILDGFTNYAFPNKRVEEIAQRRASICAECPYAKYSGAIETVTSGETNKQIKGMYCDVCGCGLSAKIRSVSSWCPKNKW